MKKILFISTSTTTGGAEKTLFTLATLVDPKVCRVAGVVSLKTLGRFGEKLRATGLPVYTLGVQTHAGLGDLQRLAVVIHETKPDLVHAIMYQAIQLCRGVKRLGYADFKLISSPRVNYRTRSGLSLLIDRWLRSADDLVITECNASKSYMVDGLGYPEKKLRTIRNGVDIAGWPISKAARARLRKELRVGDKELLLGTIGRLDYQKGYPYLLEAMAKLRASHPVKLLVLGEGPLRAELEQLALKLHLGDHVLFAGEVEDIPSWLSALDIFVLASLWEGLPNALLEAMAMGLPVVATSVDGVPEAVSKDISGLLCAPKDSQALFMQLQDLVVDAELRKTLGNGAKMVIQEHFQLSRMLSEYEAAYREVLGPEEPA